MPKVKSIGLNVSILTVGDRIRHKTAGYTAKILSLSNRGSGLITVENTPENLQIWGGKLPADFKANNLFKHFTKIYLPYNQTSLL